MSGAWSRSLRLGLIAGVLLMPAGCGSGHGRSGGGKTLGGVGACLERAGYGVTVVPAAEIAADGPENRGPGQTGELLVGRQGLRPSVGADNADAVVAFWKSSSLAKRSPNVRARTLGVHADAIGAITIQPTTHLILYAVRVARTSSGRGAALQGQIKKLEACVG